MVLKVCPTHSDKKVQDETVVKKSKPLEKVGRKASGPTVWVVGPPDW